jgi:hypothetical protein
MEGRIVEGSDGIWYEFTWDGFDEGDRNSGIGWVKVLEDNKIEGEFRIHLGDHSKFWATRTE